MSRSAAAFAGLAAVVLAAEIVLPRLFEARLPRDPRRNARVLRDWDRYVQDTIAARGRDERVVLLLSNSQGRGPEQPAELTYAVQLENALNGTGGRRVRVVNWSVAATRVPEVVVLLARARALAPDVVLSVFPPNWFVESEGPLTQMASDVADTAWLHRAHLPASFGPRYFDRAAPLRAAAARAWPTWCYRDLPVFALAVREPWVRPLVPEAVQGPWWDFETARVPYRSAPPAPAVALPLPDPELVRLFADAARALPARTVFVLQPLPFRIPPRHEIALERLRRSLASEGLDVWDLSSAVVWSSFYDDTTHLTPAGHRRVADMLEARVRPLLAP